MTTIYEGIQIPSDLYEKLKGKCDPNAFGEKLSDQECVKACALDLWTDLKDRSLRGRNSNANTSKQDGAKIPAEEWKAIRKPLENRGLEAIRGECSHD